jgi:DNA-directed RNA polymerase subunit F
MNQKDAFEILGIREDAYSEQNSLTDDALKKAYRAKILQYHPDKNKSPDAAAKFIEVQDAYKFLYSESEDQHVFNREESYNDTLKSFWSSVLREETSPLISKIIEIICKKICAVLDNNMEHIVYYLRNINRDTLQTIRSILSKYRHVLHFTSDIFDKIDEILEANEYIILNPTLDDLLSDDNIYILKYESKSYAVPLWHHEMTFEHEMQNLNVRCFPVLPENMELDEMNVLTVRLQYHLHELWDTEVVVEIGSKSFHVSGKDLRLTSHIQKVEFDGRGVPYNNMDDVLDESQKQPVIFIINIIP